ncbi:MAG: 4Fe-4S dicluster domain-containing protein [Desulfobacterales bacterium]|jgi:Fe-S-cluster-containing dehydrogenase component
MTLHEIYIDNQACWGCKTCEVACKQEMDTPAGVRLIEVSEDGPKKADGALAFAYHVNMCQHCSEPPCVDACPEEAIVKRSDGIVVMDDNLCSGCQACIEVCPYDAIDFDDDQSIAQKCNLCHHRVDQGLIPACADNVCLAHCIYFGDSIGKLK